MNEDQKRKLAKKLTEIGWGYIDLDVYCATPSYWHHDEDFAVFMDCVLHPVDEIA